MDQAREIYDPTAPNRPLAETYQNRIQHRISAVSLLKMQFDFDLMPRSIGLRGHTSVALRPRSISSKQLARRRCCIALGGKLLYIEPHSKVMVNCSIVGDMHDA